MSEPTQISRLVYTFPRVKVSSTWYGEKCVTVGRAHFWPDSRDTWNGILKLPRPPWLDIFREFPFRTKSAESQPAEGTLLIADDNSWLQQHVSRIVAILFVAGVEENRWEVPAEAFQYHGFEANANPADLVVLNTKTSRVMEDILSLRLLPPLELRAVSPTAGVARPLTETALEWPRKRQLVCSLKCWDSRGSIQLRL